ncbi:MAG: hypothetical protein ACYSU5_11325 [Planctomycetota bacterium]
MIACNKALQIVLVLAQHIGSGQVDIGVATGHRQANQYKYRHS